MNINFKEGVSEIFEKSAQIKFNSVRELTGIELVCERNNLIEKNDIDLIINTIDSYIKIDVQNSFNFDKFGDIRIDLVSAGFRKENFKDVDIAKINSLINGSKNKLEKLKEVSDVKKWGKVLHEKELEGVMYFLIDGEDPNKNKNITIKEFMDECGKRYIAGKFSYVYIPNVVLKNLLINDNINKEIKVNNKEKNNLKEEHDSAFACVKLKEIEENYDIIVENNINDFQNKLASWFKDNKFNFIKRRTNKNSIKP